MSQSTCIRAHESEHMSQSTCIRAHESEYMSQSTWVRAHESEHMHQSTWVRAHASEHFSQSTWVRAHECTKSKNKSKLTFPKPPLLYRTNIRVCWIGDPRLIVKKEGSCCLLTIFDLFDIVKLTLYDRILFSSDRALFSRVRDLVSILCSKPISFSLFRSSWE